MWSESRQYKALVEFTGAGDGKRLLVDFHSITAMEETESGVTIHTTWLVHDVSQTMDEVLERIVKVTGVKRMDL